MPNCFTLTRKGDAKPSNLVEVDEALCQHFGAEIHPTRWYREWYNIEGLAFAVGKDWEWMRENFPERLAVIDYLQEHYIVNAWYERK
jgi:hypothetical protein